MTKTTECSDQAKCPTVEDVHHLHDHVQDVIASARSAAGQDDGDLAALGFISLGVQAASILLSCAASIADSQRTIAAESQMAMKDLAGEDDAPSDWRDQTL